ncbi:MULTISPECIES: DUF1657 domain-containing protein [Oceanobacillus]|uniref:DUF1657 domain-containing protein n=1 Tax=Oceanobacillus profundus TaxID=372463 RepID=A0A417YL16_9BACI|nr:DUF1657 domain-containing protein [Oceanobacillus profundus]MBR3120428.1 DUF1657 domain-containing protein [Oceanobacillus sp.]PAE30224.1 hypothetical protein CHI07_05260 [Paenibacillus sp. 7884-2]MCM3397054.1 DUF1657 domain-containing protein [Oceanobacillus profundus]MDO6449830.1 DUF1657 domain-containing protein [Oceanobacillus profundus]RHW33826.1 DUF1657 domain-containing protein [Oceanobacillus profundus]
MTVGSQVKGCYSSIKSIEASLEILANKVQDEKAKQAFNQVEHIISDVKQDLHYQVIEISKQEPQY